MDYTDMDKRGYDWERTEEGTTVENSVGTLVWVRRRNGHWWPGRVLGAHEVPRSQLLFPKSGTPVKLLGKDDASVDWYNIGKSRRIKAFRCGEFDDCIEKARSFGCLRSKNREKYARRDDAILHALELERRQAEGIQNSESSLSAAAILGPSDFAKKVPVKDDLKGSDLENSHLESLESRRCTFAHTSQVSNSSDAPAKPKLSTNFDMDNGAPEVIRMRDLQDFGLQVTCSKTSKTKYRPALGAPVFENETNISSERKASCSNLPDSSLAEDANNKMESCITRLTAGVCSAPSVTKNSLLMVRKRKKHPTGSSADESSYKKRDRRRPLTQVLKKSSNRAVVLGCESSNLLSSTADCQMRVCSSDGTDATSSQDAFEQARNEFRPSSEHRDFDSQKRGHDSNYGFKRDQCRPLMDTDKGLTSFWSNYWDSGRWPSLVSAHMDFGLLLGSSYMNSFYEGTKSASCFPGVAYTGSTTSVNTSNIHKSDSFKYIQSSSSFLDTVGLETRDSRSPDCVQTDVKEPAGVSRWQAKKRRNIRKTPLYLCAEHIILGNNFQKNEEICKDQDPSARGTSGSTHIRPLKEKKLNLLVKSTDTPSNSIKRFSDGKKVTPQNVCHVRSSKAGLSCERRQCLYWINVRVEFEQENRQENVKLVSLFSEILNRAVWGHSVSVQVLESQVVSSAVWRKDRAESTRQVATRVPRCPRDKNVNQMSERDPMRKARSRSKGRKPTRKSGSTLQKTRMLSSLGPTEYIVGKEHESQHRSHGGIPPEVSKAPIVTCIPVHLVFQRIREVLYKEPGSLPKKRCEELGEDGKS